MSQFKPGKKVAVAITPKTPYDITEVGRQEWRPAQYFVLWATLTSVEKKPDGSIWYRFLPNEHCPNGSGFLPARREVFLTEAGAKNFLRRAMEKDPSIKSGSIDLDDILVTDTDRELYFNQIAD